MRRSDFPPTCPIYFHCFKLKPKPCLYETCGRSAVVATISRHTTASFLSLFQSGDFVHYEVGECTIILLLAAHDNAAWRFPKYSTNYRDSQPQSNTQYTILCIYRRPECPYLILSTNLLFVRLSLHYCVRFQSKIANRSSLCRSDPLAELWSWFSTNLCPVCSSLLFPAHADNFPSYHLCAHIVSLEMPGNVA